MTESKIEAKEIFELSRRLSDPVQTRNDMMEAMNLMTGMLRERYINRMNETLSKIHEHSRREPPKEVTLLRSLKPFMRPESHAGIDRMTEMLFLADVFGRLREAAAEESGVRSAGKVVHDDGVYEVDEECMERKSRGAIY